jgi:hypothetical protein
MHLTAPNNLPVDLFAWPTAIPFRVDPIGKE